MNTMHRHNSRIAAIGALFAMAYPLAGAAAEDGRFEKLSVYLERNVQDRDAEIRFEVTGATDGLAALKVTAPGARTGSAHEIDSGVLARGSPRERVAGTRCAL